MRKMLLKRAVRQGSRLGLDRRYAIQKACETVSDRKHGRLGLLEIYKGLISITILGFLGVLAYLV